MMAANCLQDIRKSVAPVLSPTENVREGWLGSRLLAVRRLAAYSSDVKHSGSMTRRIS